MGAAGARRAMPPWRLRKGICGEPTGAAVAGRREVQGEVLLPNQRQEHCCDEGDGGKRSLVARGEKVSYQTVG